MKSDCSKDKKVHLYGPTLDCIMCGEAKLCDRCGKKHSRVEGFRREVIRFLTVLREIRGIGIALRREQLVATAVEMTNLMVKGGPEVPPSEDEIACYVGEFIENARKNRSGNANASSDRNTGGGDKPSAS